MRVQFVDGASEEYEDEPLKSGAQGSIHRPYKAGGYHPGEDPAHVVKLYNDMARAARNSDRTEKLINRFNPTADEPYWAEYFAWPEKQVVLPRPGFRMRFAQRMRRLDQYLEIFDAYYDLKPNERGWFIGRLVIALKLAAAADQMARMGLCYADFSHRNVMVDIYEGRMMLIDCDALTVPNVIKPEIRGTDKYLAPELVSGKTTDLSTLTDRHSLAVLFYTWLLGWHPLDGDKFFNRDTSVDVRLRFGEQALYIEDPTDHSNQAKRQVLKTAILGDEIAALFRKAFVDGLHSPHNRPTPGEWVKAYSRAYDRVVPCASPVCDWRFFIADPGQGLSCPRCEEPVSTVQTLPKLIILPHNRSSDPEDYRWNVVGAHYVVGWPDRTLHDWHMRPEVSGTYVSKASAPDRTPRARFEYDPSHDAWYLFNNGVIGMRFRFPGEDRWNPWPPGASLQLRDRLLLQFGDAPDHNRALVQVVKVR